MVQASTEKKMKDRIRLWNAYMQHDKKFGEMQRSFEKCGTSVIKDIREKRTEEQIEVLNQKEQDIKEAIKQKDQAIRESRNFSVIIPDYDIKKIKELEKEVDKLTSIASSSEDSESIETSQEVDQ